MRALANAYYRMLAVLFNLMLGQVFKEHFIIRNENSFVFCVKRCRDLTRLLFTYTNRCLFSSLCREALCL